MPNHFVIYNLSNDLESSKTHLLCNNKEKMRISKHFSAVRGPRHQVVAIMVLEYVELLTFQASSPLGSSKHQKYENTL